MQKSTISIDVTLDEHKIPNALEWSATNSTAENKQKAKALILALWDGADKSAMRIDLWTNEMMVDEMADFFYQTFFSMADTFKRATQDEALSEEIKAFAKKFMERFRENQMQKVALK